jgi:hypothetical protein
LQVAQHAEGGAAGAEIDHRDGVIDAAVGHLVRHQLAGVLEREGLDIDDPGRQPAAATAARRCSTFSVREATSSTSSDSESLSERPRTSKS